MLCERLKAGRRTVANCFLKRRMKVKRRVRAIPISRIAPTPEMQYYILGVKQAIRLRSEGNFTISSAEVRRLMLGRSFLSINRENLAGVPAKGTRQPLALLRAKIQTSSRSVWVMVFGCA
jgi:hypothetical protein